VLERDAANQSRYHLEFVFDASTECVVTIHYATTEQTDPSGAVRFKHLRDGMAQPSEVFPKGLAQTFRTKPERALDLSQLSPEELAFDAAQGRFPLIICLEVAAGAETSSNVSSQTTFVDIVRAADGGLTARPIKQKIQVGTAWYELQEIYGIEGQKAAAAGDAAAAAGGEEPADSGRECAICMSVPRDTTVLPCRHMCAARRPSPPPRRTRSHAHWHASPLAWQVHVQRLRKGAAPAVQQVPHMPQPDRVAAADQSAAGQERRRGRWRWCSGSRVRCRARGFVGELSRAAQVMGEFSSPCASRLSRVCSRGPESSDWCAELPHCHNREMKACDLLHQRPPKETSSRPKLYQNFVNSCIREFHGFFCGSPKRGNRAYGYAVALNVIAVPLWLGCERCTRSPAPAR
jgi:hypothetical protein